MSIFLDSIKLIYSFEMFKFQNTNRMKATKCGEIRKYLVNLNFPK